MRRAEIFVENIYRIFSCCYPQFRLTRKSFENLMIHSDSHIISYPDERNTIGFAIIEGPAIRMICVDPVFQRQGIGASLLAEVEKYLYDQGYDKIYTGGVSSKFLIGADKATAGFFENNSFSIVGGCDEMLMKLDSFHFDERMYRGHFCAEYGWYNGNADTIAKAVAEVEESWIKYFDARSHIYVATVDNEIASFCLVDTDVKNYLTDAYGRVGMPGCVGTVPRFRNRGIALEMVARVTQYLKDSGMDISFIYFTGVADWYKRVGYETFITEVFMEKQLIV